MKFTWEEKDVRGGRTVNRQPVTQGSTMIGYDVGTNGAAKYCLIDLRDGAVLRAGSTKVGIADLLNDGLYRPEGVE